MTAIFVDTNILVYAATPLSGPDATKSELAVISEDLNHGQLYGGVVVQNPFVDLQSDS